MQAGRELDALIAEKVMGWVPNGYEAYTTPNGYRLADEAPHYSRDIAAAWQVVEKMMSDGWRFALNDRNGEDTAPYWAEFATDEYERGGQAWSVTAPLAICLAALKALEASHDHQTK